MICGVEILKWSSSILYMFFEKFDIQIQLLFGVGFELPNEMDRERFLISSKSCVIVSCVCSLSTKNKHDVEGGADFVAVRTRFAGLRSGCS